MNTTVTSFGNSPEELATAIGEGYGYGIYMTLKGREPISFLDRHDLTGFRCVVNDESSDCYCLSQYSEEIVPLGCKLAELSHDVDDEIEHIEVFCLDEKTFERIWKQLNF